MANGAHAHSLTKYVRVYIVFNLNFIVHVLKCENAAVCSSDFNICHRKIKPATFANRTNSVTATKLTEILRVNILQENMSLPRFSDPCDHRHRSQVAYWPGYTSWVRRRHADPGLADGTVQELQVHTTTNIL